MPGIVWKIIIEIILFIIRNIKEIIKWLNKNLKIFLLLFNLLLLLYIIVFFIGRKRASCNCLYDAEIIENLIIKEAEAVLNEDLDIIKCIYSKKVIIKDDNSGDIWHEPISKYRNLFKNYDFIEAFNYNIQPEVNGFFYRKAKAISGSRGKYVSAEGEQFEYYGSIGSCYWEFEKNILGNWKITCFIFNRNTAQ